MWAGLNRQDSLANISFMEKVSFHCVMDKGFYSGPNIDAFYADHKKFTIGVPFTVGFVCDAVEEFRDPIRSHHNFCTVLGDELYAVTKSMTWDGHRFYVHIYYDSFKAALDEKKFDHILYCCMPEEGSRVHIYFLEHEEQGAMAVHALRMGKSAGGGNQGTYDADGGLLLPGEDLELDFVYDARDRLIQVDVIQHLLVLSYQSYKNSRHLLYQSLIPAIIIILTVLHMREND